MQLEQSVLPPTPEHVRVQTPPRYRWNSYQWASCEARLAIKSCLVLCARWVNESIQNPFNPNITYWWWKSLTLGTFTLTRWASHRQGTNHTVWPHRHQQGRVTRVHLLNPLCFVSHFFRTLLPDGTFSSSNFAHMLVLHGGVNVCSMFSYQRRFNFFWVKDLGNGWYQYIVDIFSGWKECKRCKKIECFSNCL